MQSSLLGLIGPGTLADRLSKLDVDAATPDGELIIALYAANSLKEFISSSETRATRAELQTYRTLDKMSEIC